jgi:hypothetical protein
MRLPRAAPILDPATIGVSFVDILFALAVTQVFMPIASWAQDPKKSPLPALSWWGLIVALTITVTSWIGYHTSANKARFAVQFFNVEFLKLVLDVAMVAVYFVLAAFAVNTRPMKPETLLVVVAFLLYAAWDLASVYQKRDGLDNPYRLEWKKIQDDEKRLDVTEDWTPTDWGRVRATWAALVAATVIWLYVWFLESKQSLTADIVINVLLIVILFGYRFLKELWQKPTSSEPLSTGTSPA